MIKLHFNNSTESNTKIKTTQKFLLRAHPIVHLSGMAGRQYSCQKLP